MTANSCNILQVKQGQQGHPQGTSWWAVIGMVVCLASPPGAEAGFISTDFNSGLPAGTAIFGDAVIDGGVLKLTNTLNSQHGAFYVDSLDSGQAVNSFTATFKALVGGGTGDTGGLPADGFSFNFADDLPVSGSFSYEEEGTGTGLTVSFDSYDNGGGEAPAIDVKVGGSTIASFFTAISLGMNFVDVLIDLHADGTLDVSYDGVAAFTGLATGYTPITDGQFAFGARTGGFNDNHWIDDLSIVTTTTAVAVPEPATLTLLTLGLAGLGFTRRRILN